MNEAVFLVFGDLHGRVLPAFRLAIAWGREHSTRIDGILQVGDLGYFPDPTRLDKATKRHAAKDPLELGVQFVTSPSREADAIFAEPDVPQRLWFTQGNHEDFEALALLEHGSGSADSFVVDHYCMVRCLKDGRVATLPGGLRVGTLWGIDDRAPNARPKTPKPGRIRERSALHLSFDSFDVLLTHESPRDMIYPDSGSDLITMVLDTAQPAFAFFGHYHPRGTVTETRGRTQVYHMHGLEFRGRDGCAEPGCAGVLRWKDGAGTFAYLDPAWLRTVTRHNWKHR